MKSANKSSEISINRTIDININENELYNNILIIGNTYGLFGHFSEDSIDLNADKNTNLDVVGRYLCWFVNNINNNARFVIVSNSDTMHYYSLLFDFLETCDVKKFNRKKQIRVKVIDNENDQIDFLDKMKKKGEKFDYIIQNPPYSGNLHLSFFEKGLDLLSDNGKMTIIEPATWLIDLKFPKKNNNVGKYFNHIKEVVGKHVYRIVIENYNKEFGTALYVPFSVTYIDKAKEYDEISVSICGDEKVIDNINDCNLIGKYDVVQSIFRKCQSYGDMMGDHVWKQNKKVQEEKMYYCKSSDMLGGWIERYKGTVHVGADYNSDNIYVNHKSDEYVNVYTSSTYHYNDNYISDKPLCAKNSANKLTDKPAACLTDTKEHLENWKYFIFNNKLPLFLNICLTIDQHNNSKQYVPWLVDKHYTDEEINKLFGFTEEEIKLMDDTLVKFERKSEWFKRYMVGIEEKND